MWFQFVYVVVVDWVGEVGGKQQFFCFFIIYISYNGGFVGEFQCGFK